MNFIGKWRLRNGWEALISTTENGMWIGKIIIGATSVVGHWDSDGNYPANKELDIMEQLGWRARV